ncbi:MAG TPA: response regulator [Pyrinomonadaceae bacterium]|nr:response regulator [Pyrinomonadaceae bacterium]
MRTDFEPDHNSTTFADNCTIEAEQAGTEAARHLRDGIKAAQAGDRAAARASLLRAAQLDPQSESVWLWLSSISEYPEELLVFLNNVLEINPTNERALEWSAATRSLMAKNFVHRGIDAAETGDNEAAIRHFKQALEHDEKDLMAWLWLASTAGSDEEKLEYLDRAAAIDPANDQAKTEIEAIRTRKYLRSLDEAKRAAVTGETVAAAAMIDELLKDNPDSVDGWMLKAHVSSRMDEKIAAFEKVVQIDPHNSAASAGLESLRSLIGSFAVAEEMVNSEAPAAPEYWAKDELSADPVVAVSDLEIDEQPAPGPEQKADETDEAVISYEIVDTTWPSDSSEDRTDQGSGPEQSDETANWSSESNQNDVFQSSLQFDGASSFADFYNSDEGTGSGSVTNEVVFELTEDDAEATPSSEPNWDETRMDMSPVSNEQSGDDFPLSDANYSAQIADDAEDYCDIQSFDGSFANGEVSSEYSDGDSYEVPPTLVSIELDEETRDALANYDAGVNPFASFAVGSPQPMMPFEQTQFGESSTTSGATEMETPQSSAVAAVPDEGYQNESFRTASCPFCSLENDGQAFTCQGCFAVLTLSDIELVLANQQADKNAIRKAVDEMESERLRREYSEAELTTLGIGHLNLRNLQFGYNCLHEASQLNPDNVLLGAQVNSLLIRLDEIRRQEEAHGSMVTGKTILVVDDSPTVRKLIAGKLEKCGHEVHCSSDGVEAIEQLESLRPDLVLLDIAMPKMDGYQVCKLIRSNTATKDVPVVMISGKDGFFDKVRGRMAGTSGYITKPFGPETLMKAVDSYLRGAAEAS